jgi:hypothetical protein
MLNSKVLIELQKYFTIIEKYRGKTIKEIRDEMHIE